MSLFAVLNKTILDFLGLTVVENLINSAPLTIIEYNFERKMYCVTQKKIEWLKKAKINLNLNTSNILENVKWSKWGRYSYINNDICNTELDEKKRISGSSINKEYNDNILSKNTELKLECQKNKYMTNLILLRRLYKF